MMNILENDIQEVNSPYPCELFKLKNTHAHISYKCTFVYECLSNIDIHLGKRVILIIFLNYRIEKINLRNMHILTH